MKEKLIKFSKAKFSPDLRLATEIVRYTFYLIALLYVTLIGYDVTSTLFRRETIGDFQPSSDGSSEYESEQITENSWFDTSTTSKDTSDKLLPNDLLERSEPEVVPASAIVSFDCVGEEELKLVHAVVSNDYGSVKKEISANLAVLDKAYSCFGGYLFLAAMYSNAQMVQLILSLGAHPDHPHTIESRTILTPLAVAVLRKDADITRVLLSYGASGLEQNITIENIKTNVLRLAQALNRDRLADHIEGEVYYYLAGASPLRRLNGVYSANFPTSGVFRVSRLEDPNQYAVCKIDFLSEVVLQIHDSDLRVTPLPETLDYEIEAEYSADMTVQNALCYKGTSRNTVKRIMRDLAGKTDPESSEGISFRPSVTSKMTLQFGSGNLITNTLLRNFTYSSVFRETEEDLPPRRMVGGVYGKKAVKKHNAASFSFTGIEVVFCDTLLELDRSVGPSDRDFLAGTPPCGLYLPDSYISSLEEMFGYKLSGHVVIRNKLLRRK